MRAAEATEALTQSLKNHFPNDVAAAIAADTSALREVVASVVGEEIDANTLDGRIFSIAVNTNDATKDRLASGNPSPAAWLRDELDQWW